MRQFKSVFVTKKMYSFTVYDGTTYVWLRKGRIKFSSCVSMNDVISRITDDMVEHFKDDLKITTKTITEKETKGFWLWKKEVDVEKRVSEYVPILTKENIYIHIDCVVDCGV